MLFKVYSTLTVVHCCKKGGPHIVSAWAAKSALVAAFLTLKSNAVTCTVVTRLPVACGISILLGTTHLFIRGLICKYKFNFLIIFAPSGVQVFMAKSESEKQKLG